MGKRNVHLFKERITRSAYAAQIRELSDAIDAGPAALTKLLFGTDNPELYADHGAYVPGQHHCCLGLTGDRFTEKRLCKCMYFRSGPYARHCEECGFQDRFEIVGNYWIEDYEVPAFYYGDGIGEIDLIIRQGDISYATEVKPYRGNRETLLRMAAEILTYTQGYPEGQYEKAIAFFEKNRKDGRETEQQLEYARKDPAMMALLQKAGITVFRFEEVGHKEYQICKL